MFPLNIRHNTTPTLHLFVHYMHMPRDRHDVQCTVYTLQYTLCNVPCTVYTTQRELHNGHIGTQLRR